MHSVKHSRNCDQSRPDYGENWTNFEIFVLMRLISVCAIVSISFGKQFFEVKHMKAVLTITKDEIEANQHFALSQYS